MLGTAVTLSAGCIVRNASASLGGGAVAASTTLAVSSSSFFSASTPLDGGALAANLSLTATNVTFVGCSAGGRGGSAFSGGPATLMSSTVQFSSSALEVRLRGVPPHPPDQSCGNRAGPE